MIRENRSQYKIGLNSKYNKEKEITATEQVGL